MLKLLEKFKQSSLTATDFVNSIAVRIDDKLPLWSTEGAVWFNAKQVKGYRVHSDFCVPAEYRNTLINLLTNISMDEYGKLNGNRDRILLMQKELTKMFNSNIEFYPNPELELKWKDKDLTDINVFGWDDKMKDHPILKTKIVHTSTRAILDNWMEGTFNCKKLIYYTTDNSEHLALVIQKNNLDLDCVIINSSVPENVTVIKKSSKTEYLKYHVQKWKYVCDWDWSEVIEQRARSIQASIPKEEQRLI